jgi:hypothetical protein
VLNVQAPSGYARTDSAAHVADGGELVDECVDPAALPGWQVAAGIASPEEVIDEEQAASRPSSAACSTARPLSTGLVVAVTDAVCVPKDRYARAERGQARGRAARLPPE